MRPGASCLVADEALAEELVRSRALRHLGLARLAPTVLSSPEPVEEVLLALRRAGHFPVREDTGGALVVERAEPRRASEAPTGARREPVATQEVIRRLRTDPGPADSDTLQALAQLNRHLEGAELELLADGVDHERDVAIAYRDQNGSVTQRVITPRQFLHRRLIAWCHLRRAEREFTVASVLAVGPAG